MNVKELRMGSWVSCKGKSTKVCTIILNANKFEVTTTVFKNQPIENIKGIEIDEDWLRRYGFTKTLELDSHDVWRLEPEIKGSNTNEIIFHITKIEEVESWGSYVVNSCWSANNFKFVHELQNLYIGITGNELEKIKE